MHHPDDPYYISEDKYYYIYFDNQYYVSELIKTRHLNYFKELIFRENTIDLWTVTKLDGKLIKSIDKGKKAETNILRTTALFKEYKKQIRKLRYEFSKEFERDYHDFIGKIYDEKTYLLPTTKERIERLLENVKTQAEQYPPELISVCQLVRRQKMKM